MIILSFDLYFYLDKEIKDNKTYDVIENAEELINYPIENSFSLVATGDALIHSDIYLQYQTTNGFDFSNIFSEVKDYINNYDVKYINQETVFANQSYSGYPLFNTPSSWGDDMIDAGFNLFSLATNHSYDTFYDGAIESITYWHSKENIGYAGMNLSDEDENYYINEVNGITYGFLSYTEQTNGLTIPDEYSYVVEVYEKQKVQEDINELEKQVDIIIVAMHWGTEYTSEPNDNQVQMANELSEMGVNVILGNHPHWIQPIDYINDTLVIYSMGNFISNQLILKNSSYYTESVAVGALVSFDINMLTYENGEKKVSTDNINVELIYNYRYSDGEYKVIPFSQMTININSNYEKIYEEHKERLTMYSNLVKVNELS